MSERVDVFERFEVGIDSANGFVLGDRRADEGDFDLLVFIDSGFERTGEIFDKAAAGQLNQRRGVEDVMLLPGILIDREFYPFDLPETIIAPSAPILP